MQAEKNTNNENQDWKVIENQYTPLVVIVPLGPGEESWRSLLGDLCVIEKGLHVVLVAVREDEKAWKENESDWIAPFERNGLDVEVQFCEKGRGRQINYGILHTDEPWIWVLHADTRLRRPCFYRLRRGFESFPDQLFFFDLEFQDDGPKWMWANAFGAKIRSKHLNIPFGDQGFAFSREVFHQIGPFREDLKSGEDHAFVWKVHRNKIPVKGLDARILTSARRYQEKGWVRTTVRHLALTYFQAAPEWFRSKRIGKK